MAAWQREFGLWAAEMNMVVYLGDVTSRNKVTKLVCLINSNILYDKKT